MPDSTELAEAKPKLAKPIMEAITEIAVEKAIEVWKDQEEKQQKKWYNDRINETRRLFQSYKANKIALEEESEYTDAEKAEMRLAFLEDLMGKPDQGLMRSERQIYNAEHRIAKRMIEIQRVDQVMKMYKRETELSGSPEQQRRYRIVVMKYLDDKPKEIEEIAMAELVSEKTVYRDMKIAMEVLSEYLYGY